MRRLVVVVEGAILAAVVWLVGLSRRTAQQVYAPSFADHLRVTSIAVAVAGVAGVVAWAASRHDRSRPLIAFIGAVGVGLAVGAARRPALPEWVTVLVDSGWLATAAAVIGAALLSATVRDGVGRRLTYCVLAAVAATGVAAAILDGGAGLRSTLGSLPSADVALPARVALAAHVVVLTLGGLWLARRAWSSRPPATRYGPRGPLLIGVAAIIWFGSALAERVVPLLPVATFRDLGRGTYRPWAMVVGVHVPLVTCGALLVVMGWLVAVRPRVSALPTGVLMLRDQDPVAMLRDDLAAWLGDPSLQLAFADGAGGWVAPTGDVCVDTSRYDRAATIVTRDEQPVGLLVHDVALASAPDAVATAAALAGLAFDANRLVAVSEGGLVEAHRLSDRLLRADATTRAEVLALLEDGPLARLRASADAVSFGALLPDVLLQLRLATSEVRWLSHGVHPPELADGGLRAALPFRPGVPERRLPPAVEITAFLLAHDDADASFEDRGTTLRVHRASGTLPPGTADRVAVLGGTVAGRVIDLPVPAG
jgi:hypothetical protein